MFAPAQFNKFDNMGTAVGEHGSDRDLYAEFSHEAIYQEAESEKEGRPIFKDVPFIRILVPGDKTKQIHRPVNFESNGQQPADHERFPRQWAAFKAQEEQTQSGTPVTEWPPLTKARAMELKGMNVHTVEMLAAMPDTTVGNLGLDGKDLRTKAQAWLNKAADGAEVSKLLAENKALHADVEALRQQVAELAKSASAAAETKSKSKE